VPGRAGHRAEDRGRAAPGVRLARQPLANLDRIKQPKRRESLAANADVARLSYRLVGLNDAAPLPYRWTRSAEEPGPGELLAFSRSTGSGRCAPAIDQVVKAGEEQRAERAAGPSSGAG
jgi:hypothetical protein